MDTLYQDLRYALRAFVKNPAFSAVAVLSLALGIGANTTIFSFVNGLLLRPPAVKAPDELVEIWQRNATRGNGIGSHMQLSFPEYEHYRDHNRVFADMGAFTAETSSIVWNRGGEGQVLRCSMVSGNFFSVLGLQPAAGRLFHAGDEREGHLVVLSHALWTERFAADPSVVGSEMTLNGRSFTVVGIAPPGFSGLLAGFVPELWTPLARHDAVNPALKLTERRQHWILGIGRLKRGMTRAHARADLTVLGQQLATEFPETNRNLLPSVLPVDLVPAPFRTVAGGASGVLMAVVALVLLIACGNVANLLLAKAAGRRREVAVRLALGANRRRIVQQMLTESVLIAGIAGVLGLLLSMWTTPLLLSLKPAALPLAIDASPDVRVLAFTLLASLLTGIAFGLAPALQQSRVDQVANLKDGSQQAGSGRSRLRNGLVIAQVAACVVLLVAAGLCLRSLMHARSIDPGFEMAGGFTASLSVEPFGYDEARGRTFYAELLQRVRAIPGVRAASLADHLPLGQISRMAGVEVPGRDGTSATQATIDMAVVAPDYFEAIGTPIVRGRGFTAQDNTQSAPVVIVNQRMADRFWPGDDAIGRFVTFPGPGNRKTRAQVIGVAKTGKYQTLGEDPKPYFYRPLLQEYVPSGQLIVRAQDSAGVLPALREQVRGLDARLALVGVQTLEQHMQLPLFPAQAAGLLLGMFGSLALGLAIVGLYGVIAYSVSQRTREIGVRMALGARPADVLRLVLGQGLRLTLIGVALGLAGAFAVSRVLSSILYGISASDPVSFSGVALLLVVVALAASYLPARWATRVDPMQALRSQ